MDVKLLLYLMAYLNILISVNMTPATQRKGSAFPFAACGTSKTSDVPQIIDKATHECVNGVPVELPKVATNVPAVVEQKTNQSADKMPIRVLKEKMKLGNKLPTRHTDTLTCGSVEYSGPNEGYRCCETKKYHPDFETCCRMSSNIFQVHSGKKEENYVCCDTKAYRRRSWNIPCQHPASNDKVWRAKSLKMSANEVCNGRTPAHEYLLRIGEPVNFHGYTYFTSDLKEIHSQNGSTKTSRTVNVQYDEYSRIKNLRSKKRLLIRSNVNYLTVTDLYLDPRDKVYKVPRNVKVFRKRYNAIKRQCNNISSRRRRKRHQRGRRQNRGRHSG